MEEIVGRVQSSVGVSVKNNGLLDSLWAGAGEGGSVGSGRGTPHETSHR